MLLADSPALLHTPAGVEPAFDLQAYYPILIYLAICLAIPIIAIAGSHFIGPRRRTAVKLMPYESGMDPIGSAQHKFDVKFYLIAILFLVFDVELLFLYPWAVMAYTDPDPVWKAVLGRVVFIEIIVFLATVAVAYVYAWRKGVFQWR
jgi:NADH:ubiquinone oxidoreductase subunit 3 (subunit A)